MKKQLLPFLLLTILCLVQNSWAQDLRNAVIQEDMTDYVAVEFESYSYLIDRAPSATTLHSWTEVADANASGGAGLQAGGGSVDGGDPLMLGKVKFDIVFAAAGSYYLYLRGLGSGGTSNTLCVPDGFNKPSCSGENITPADGSTFRWIKKTAPLVVDPSDVGNVLTLTFFPDEDDVIIDKWILEQTNNLTDTELDAITNTPQQLPLPPQGVIGVSSFESFVWEFPIDAGASSNYDPAVSFPGVSEDYFPYVGLQFLHMDQTDMSHLSGNSTVVMEPIVIDPVLCYNVGASYELCFRWMSPAAIDGSFSGSDEFTVSVLYQAADLISMGAPVDISSETLLSLSGGAINTGGDCYEQTCVTLSVPATANQFVLTFNLVSDNPLEDIWLDQISLETNSANAPLAEISNLMITGSTVEADSDDSENAVGYIWVASDGTVEDIAGGAPSFEHTFASDGTYLICLIVGNLCLGYHVDCETVTIVTPLPVELTTFTATRKEEDVLLKWTTETETNNSHYIVEHSFDNARFNPIGRLEGAGTTLEPQAYEFLHEDPGAGTHYYRLLQVDFDDEAAYSEIVSVKMDAEPRVSIFPNPFKQQLQLAYDPSLNLAIELMDTNGRVLLKQALTTNSLDLSFVNAGIYYLNILDENGRIISREKVVKLD